MLFVWGAVAAVAGILLGLILIRPYYEEAQKFDLGEIDDLQIASVIYDRNGTEIGRIYEDENRELVTLNEVPMHLVDALVSVEDSRFYEHKGVDYVGIIRAIFLNLKAGETTQGASTITQQLARNAVMHRAYEGSNTPVRIYWFDDRVEIISPGGPYGEVTPENFGQPGYSSYRNPHIAEALKVLNLVQRFGVGIAIAQSSLRANGNPPASFQVEPTAIFARLKPTLSVP